MAFVSLERALTNWYFGVRRQRRTLLPRLDGLLKRKIPDPRERAYRELTRAHRLAALRRQRTRSVNGQAMILEAVRERWTPGAVVSQAGRKRAHLSEQECARAFNQVRAPIRLRGGVCCPPARQPPRAAQSAAASCRRVSPLRLAADTRAPAPPRGRANQPCR